MPHEQLAKLKLTDPELSSDGASLHQVCETWKSRSWVQARLKLRQRLKMTLRLAVASEFVNELREHLPDPFQNLILVTRRLEVLIRLKSPDAVD